MSNVAEATERQLTNQEQLGGSLATTEPGRFEFVLNPYVDSHSKKIGVRERHYTSNIRQVGQFIPQQNLAAAIADGLHRTIQNLILRDRIPAADRVYFNLASNRLVNSYAYRGLPAGEWLNGSDRVDSLLQQMSKVLNSNENFEMNDSFQLSFTHVRASPRGSGQKRKLKPGHSNPETFKRLKASVITIDNKDELCCARAIVTAKARVDQHPKWNSFRRGFPIQSDEAIKLHIEANVEMGKCGYEELTRFALTSTLNNYQLLLVDATRGYTVTSFGKPQEKQIVLLYDNEHYDVITTLPGFFGNSYFCARCLKPYNNEGQHACENNPDHCSSCLQTGCEDFTEARCRNQPPATPCGSCKRMFYGDVCFQNHLTKSYKGNSADSENISVCSQRRKCSSCKKLLVGLKQQKEHECGNIDCPSCHEYIEAASHQCFIQIPKTPEELTEEKKEKKKRKRRTEAEAEDNSDDDKPPVLVFFDIEATQDTGKHIPNLLIAETEDDNCPLHFKGEDCIRGFLEWLDRLTEGDTRNVTVLAHNLSGCDSYFVVEEYHRQHRVLNQIRNGAKLLQLTFDNINFIDSLSFFQMPLSAFPKTFGLTELKKGYFPHLFNTPENQDYVGPLPDKEFYMPESMSVSGRKDFEKWHDKERAENVVFDFQKELLEYCESDAKLLKEGCLTFKRLFEKETKFDPFSHITIASACNRDLRQNRMEANTIASEPLHGWRLKTNQSKVAMEYLLWQQSQISGRIQHVGNDGEYRIPNSRYTVDGYHATTNTVYEFQGCFWHGCRKCYPTDPKHILDWSIAALPTCISAPRKNFDSCVTKVTTSLKCGSVIGGKRKKKGKTSETL